MTEVTRQRTVTFPRLTMVLRSTKALFSEILRSIKCPDSGISFSALKAARHGLTLEQLIDGFNQFRSDLSCSDAENRVGLMLPSLGRVLYRTWILQLVVNPCHSSDVLAVFMSLILLSFVSPFKAR